MDPLSRLLCIGILVGVWAIWYELRYGIENRRHEQEGMKRLSDQWKSEREEKAMEFEEARKSPEAWAEYMKNNKP